jgi:hypothetical protein
MKPFEYVIMRVTKDETILITEAPKLMVAEHEGVVKMEAVRTVDSSIPSGELKVYVRPFV